MAIGSTATHPTLSSYELVGRRIQGLVSNPNAQKIQAVTVVRREDEPEESWERVLSELGATDGVVVDRALDGSVRIGWRMYIDG